MQYWDATANVGLGAWVTEVMQVAAWQFGQNAAGFAWVELPLANGSDNPVLNPQAVWTANIHQAGLYVLVEVP